ncbi:DUF3182 family protein [Piscinibacter sakaiensis]|uniref:DUF3182 family protein n=1 Tax=Piscinibacter sakaiensis TaxID=1547922 RepID=UPI003AAE9053
MLDIQTQALWPTGENLAETPPRGVVLAYSHADNDFACLHERATRVEIARRLARLKGFDFGGSCDARSLPQGSNYLVPNDTVVGELDARRLDIRSPDDLFGGVVPFAFVASKAITHPLLGAGSPAPAGWSNRFPLQVTDAVHEGWTAFVLEDAFLAGNLLLKGGPVRVKQVHATGGRGQQVVRDCTELRFALEAFDPDEMAANGVVLERNLEEVTTFSVGQVIVGDLVATYHGSQRTTTDNRGETVYGGSTLQVVRGGFETLLATALPVEVRLAVAQARRYHEAALSCFPGMILSRINYDIARGRDANGHWRSGVLEQSWRLGGASGAEVLALEHFAADPACRSIRVAGHEVYGSDVELPEGAAVFFAGEDPIVGMLSKFAVVEVDGHT